MLLLPCIAHHQQLCLLEPLAPAAFLKVELSERRRRLGFRVGIVCHDVDDHLHHLLFLVSLCGGLPAGEIDGKVGVDPDLDVSLVVHADLMFLNLEIF